MEINKRQELINIANQKRATRVYKGTNKLTQTSINTNHRIHHAKLLYEQATTAGGWHILRNEIETFLQFN